MISTKELEGLLEKIGNRAYNEVGLTNFEVDALIATTKKDVKNGTYRLIVEVNFVTGDNTSAEHSEKTLPRCVPFRVNLDIDQKRESAMNKILKKFHKIIEQTHTVPASEFKACNKRAKMVAKKLLKFKPKCY